MMNTLVVHIPGDDKQALEHEAQRQHTSLSSLVRQALRDYFRLAGTDLLVRKRRIRIELELSECQYHALRAEASRQGRSFVEIVGERLRTARRKGGPAPQLQAARIGAAEEAANV